MAKAGMRRPSPYDPDNHGTENHHKMNHPKNEQAQVPEIHGRRPCAYVLERSIYSYAAEGH